MHNLPLPKAWPKRVKTAMLNVISLAHAALTCSRAWCADSPLRRVQLAGQLDQARQEIALLREQDRIKDTRMARIPPHHRPFYPPTERMAILELRAARGWNLDQTARAFLVEPATVAQWMKRLDEDGPQALVRTPVPLNKFPEFVAYIVRRLKTLCPTLGKKKIAQILARAGLQLSATSVARFINRNPAMPPPPNHVQQKMDDDSSRVVTSKYPNHLWNIDLTTIPITGFWTSWFPFTLPQRWPFCWWICLVIDHCSRRIMGFAVFKAQPSSDDLCRLLNRLIRRSQLKPKHLITDRGTQFDCENFRAWCKRKGIKNRYGAVGKYGSIAIIERFILSLKSEYLRRILVPMRLADIRHELSRYLAWHNDHRPHEALKNRTPVEAYAGKQWGGHRSHLSVRDAPLSLRVTFFGDNRFLPIVELRPAA